MMKFCWMVSCVLCAGTLRADPFAEALLSELYASERNVVFSPCSITAALAMSGAGARGETAAQMARVLQSGDTHESIVQQFTAVQKAVTAAMTPQVTFRVANAIFPQKDYAFLPDYLACVKDQFKSGVVSVDYIKDRENSRKTINQWVSERTAGRISELIHPGLLNDDARLTLINTVYFNAPWERRFYRSDTRDRPFTRPDGTVKKVPFMKREGDYHYLETESAQILDIPYTGGKLVMTLILPKTGHTIAQAMMSFSETAATPFEDTDISVSFPRFTFSAYYHLNKTLQKLGMADAFAEGRADFSGMDGTRELYISDVVHQAFIDVNESGTEAAAATGAFMAAFGPSPSQKTFFADRPFAFVIRVRDSNTPIFIGVVNNP